MNIWKVLSIIFASFWSIAQFSFAQEITEEEYLKIDTEIWEEYEQNMSKIFEGYKLYPEKKDSLMIASERILAIADKKNVEAAIKYSSVPSGLQRLFMVRLQIPKDTILSILKRLPDNMQTSSYGKNLFYHIESEQIEEGHKYSDFKAIDSEGKDFILSSLEGKNVLFLYGGLECMGKENRDYLNEIYEKTNRDSFEIVIYCQSSSLEQLQEVRKEFPCDFFLVSDFLHDFTPVKILYGAQATPTCFFINKKGVVKMKTISLFQERVNQLLEDSE